MKAEILSFDSDGAETVMCVWTLDASGAAVCSSAEDQAWMEEVGVVTSQGPVYPKDGKAFIEGLPREFSGSFIRARLVP